MIKAVTLDFWFTLYMDTPEITQEREAVRFKLLQDFLVKTDHTTAEELISDAFAAANERANSTWEQKHRSIAASESLRFMLELLNAEPDKIDGAAFVQLCHAFESVPLTLPPRLLPGAVETLAALAEKYRLAIICDTGLTPGRILKRLLNRDRISKFFSHLTFSDVFGSTKPSPQNFMHTLSLMGVKPEEAVHVGDLVQTDITGALGVGMRAVLCHAANDTSVLDDSLTHVPVIRDLRELPEIVEQFDKLDDNLPSLSAAVN